MFAKVDNDTGENEPCKVGPLSVHRSPRLLKVSVVLRCFVGFQCQLTSLQNCPRGRRHSLWRRREEAAPAPGEGQGRRQRERARKSESVRQCARQPERLLMATHSQIVVFPSARFRSRILHCRQSRLSWFATAQQTDNTDWSSKCELSIGSASANFPKMQLLSVKSTNRRNH